VRTARSTSGTPISYLWGREAGLPQLVDDGTQSYLGDGDARQQTGRTGDTTSLLPDALGSVRGLASGTSGLAGSADDDVFGAVRATSGASSTFGFAGEQSDPESGLSFLRARYYSPAVGRFFSADSLSPNAPGTQGYNPYAYAANNPTTWTDPSGHLAPPPAYWLPPTDVATSGSALFLTVTDSLIVACAWSAPCTAVLATGARLIATHPAYAAVVALVVVAVGLTVCGLDSSTAMLAQGESGPVGLFAYATYSCMETAIRVLWHAFSQGSPHPCNGPCPTPTPPPTPEPTPSPDPCAYFNNGNYSAFRSEPG
jgi:RHS repeat-associated protein